MVQGGDGRGRRNENVARIRCVFQEDDGKGKPLPLEVHIVNESSPGHYHRYLLADGLSVEEFRSVQARLVADYGSDPAAKDPARALRLPGFFHRKISRRKGLTGDPFMVRIDHESGAQPYTREEILKALPPIEHRGNGSTATDEGSIKVDVRTIKDLRSALASMRSDDRALWVAMGLALKELGDVGRGLWIEWSQTSEKYDPQDAARTWDSFKPEHTDYRSVFAEAKRRGWVNPGRGAACDESLVIRRASEIESLPVRWFWKDRIPLGKITFLVGDPDEGKSYLTASMAANVTRGWPWIDGSLCDKGSVIFVSAEDDAADTIKPRLEVMGADLEKVHFIESVSFTRKDGKPAERLFSIQEDLAALSAAIDRIGDVKLVNIDPISAFLGSCDSHINAEVRGLMGPFAKLAARHGAAFVCVSHLNKGDGAALYRITGSLAFIALARAAYLLTHDKQKPERRLLLRIKNNLSGLRTGLAFALVPKEGYATPTLAWEEGAVDMSANDALNPAIEKSKTKVDLAGEWLKEALADGPVLQETLEADAKGLGISIRTLKQAKLVIGVKSRKQTFSGKWEWFLPTPAEILHPSTEPAPDKGSSQECKLHPSRKTKQDADSRSAPCKDSAEECKLHPSNGARQNADPSEGCNRWEGVGRKKGNGELDARAKEVLEVIQRHGQPITGRGLADLMGNELWMLQHSLDQLADACVIKPRGVGWATSPIILVKSEEVS